MKVMTEQGLRVQGTVPTTGVSQFYDEFVKWFDVQCVSRWNKLCSAEAWAERFKDFYSNDEALKSILVTSRRIDGFAVIEKKLKEQVGHDDVGLVVHEIVTKLEDLSKSGRGTHVRIRPATPSVRKRGRGISPLQS